MAVARDKDDTRVRFMLASKRSDTRYHPRRTERTFQNPIDTSPENNMSWITLPQRFWINSDLLCGILAHQGPRNRNVFRLDRYGPCWVWRGSMRYHESALGNRNLKRLAKTNIKIDERPGAKRWIY